MSGDADNPNPVIYEAGVDALAVALKHRPLRQLLDPDLGSNDDWDDLSIPEVYEKLRYLSDPEHPNLSLEQLKVVQPGHIAINGSCVHVRFTPTVPTCSVATLIGLTIKAKLQRSLPKRYKVDVEINPGTHNQENEVNKQLADKERVAAALENPALRNLINNGIAGTDRPDSALLLA
mmetsp:Transcript_113043/g.324890  ORF Transcript_113043/g.324890 Transcript_113043/m.324890 type:complete len:177 (-) Transcript_113043:90-620(-)